MVKKEWGISAVHSHICAQPSLAAHPWECKGRNCQELWSKIPPPCWEKGDEQTRVETLQNGSMLLRGSVVSDLGCFPLKVCSPVGKGDWEM